MCVPDLYWSVLSVTLPTTIIDRVQVVKSEVNVPNFRDFVTGLLKSSMELFKKSKHAQVNRQYTPARQIYAQNGT